MGYNVPCLVAAIDTQSQVLVTNKFKKVKTAICDVRDRLNPGEVAGFTTGWGRLAVTGPFLVALPPRVGQVGLPNPDWVGKSAFRRGGPANQCKRITIQVNITRPSMREKYIRCIRYKT